MTKLELILALFLAGIGARLGSLGLSVEMVSALSTLVTFDVITGIWAAYSIDKRSVKSAIAVSGVLKKVGILIIPFSLAYFGKASHTDMSIYLNSCLGFIAAFELYSVLGNYFSIRQGKRVEEVDALGILWARLGQIATKFLKLPSVSDIPQSTKHDMPSDIPSDINPAVAEVPVAPINPTPLP